MNRREFISYCMRAGMSVSLSSLASMASSNEKLPKTLQHSTVHQGVVPTRIDTHGHTVSGLTPERVIALMDHAGISHMVLMARGRRNDALTTEIYKQNPQRIIKKAGCCTWLWRRSGCSAIRTNETTGAPRRSAPKAGKACPNRPSSMAAVANR